MYNRHGSYHQLLNSRHLLERPQNNHSPMPRSFPPLALPSRFPSPYRPPIHNDSRRSPERHQTRPFEERRQSPERHQKRFPKRCSSPVYPPPAFLENRREGSPSLGNNAKDENDLDRPTEIERTKEIDRKRFESRKRPQNANHFQEERYSSNKETLDSQENSKESDMEIPGIKENPKAPATESADNIVDVPVTSEREVEISPEPVETPVDTPTVPFDLTQVLGDAKIMNDILSVAKTMQFSDVAKSFPSVGRNVAVVQPNNIHEDTSCTSSDDKPVMSLQPPVFMSFMQQKKSFEPPEDNSEKQDQMDQMTTFLKEFRPTNFHEAFKAETSMRDNSDHRSLKRPFSEVPETEDPTLTKTVKLDDSSVCDAKLDDSQHSSENSVPVSSTPVFEEAKPVNPRMAVLEQLETCNVESEEDSNIVLNVISVLFEKYIKYKLGFLPDTKYQELMEALQQGKDKEVNLLENYLRDGSQNAKKTLEEYDPSLVEAICPTTSEATTPPTPTTTVATLTTNVTQPMPPFMPMFNLPMNYWMPPPFGMPPAPPIPPDIAPPPLPPSMTQLKPPPPPPPPQTISLSDVPLPPPPCLPQL